MNPGSVDQNLGVIQKLESQAEQLRALLDNNPRAAKRPLIIEFSGSPKAGKTRCIHGLELFLKRNGFRAEVFTERASIAPIQSKGHLFFNAWVSCASLQGMLESLYRELDVFILDRGLFDALVWNEWLRTTGKITQQEADALDNFFRLPQWTDLVDLVIVMSCDPQVSLEREYADQLTTKRGTIMAIDPLVQIQKAIDATIQRSGSRFKHIVTMDTTKTKTIEAVAQITGQTLDSLNTLLDESLCVIPAEAMPPLPAAGMIRDEATIQKLISAAKNDRVFEPRSKAEFNPKLFQPIPCAVITFEDSILFLKRKKKGHPLHDTYAVWAGGHVVKSDDKDGDILRTALERELSEELFIRGEYDLDPAPVGLVRTSEDARASRHVGVVYRLRLKSKQVALAINQREFRETRGTSMSGRLVDVSRITEYYDAMGDWSKFIVDEFWPDPGRRKIGTLFESHA